MKPDNISGKRKLITDFSRKGWPGYLLVLLLLAPLLFINVRDSHDWGGDFAQYIHQAMNIVDGKPQWETGYLFNKDYAMLSAPTYPVGFPILLSPVYLIWGNSILAFSYYLSLFLIACLFTGFVFLRKRTGYHIALLAVLVIAYNPWTLKFKTEIISDIPFTLFFILSIIYFLKDKERGLTPGGGIVTGAFIGICMLIKGIGITLLLAAVTDLTINVLNGHFRKRIPVRIQLVYLGVILFISLSLYLLVSKVILPGKEDTISFFSRIFRGEGLGRLALVTLDYYVQTFQGFFHPDAGKWNFVPLITKAFALTFLILGFLFRLLKKPGFLEFLLIFFMAAVLSFPNIAQGYRYLLPVTVILFYYMVTGLKSVRLPVKINNHFIIVFIACVILLQYRLDFKKILADRDNILKGPQQPEAVEAFTFIRENTPLEAKIIFIKPRVLALYTGRKSYTNHPHQELAFVEEQYARMGYDYILTCTDQENPPLNKYIQKSEGLLTAIFKNGKFVLYSNNN